MMEFIVRLVSDPSAQGGGSSAQSGSAAGAPPGVNLPDLRAIYTQIMPALAAAAPAVAAGLRDAARGGGQPPPVEPGAPAAGEPSPPAADSELTHEVFELLKEDMQARQGPAAVALSAEEMAQLKRDYGDAMAEIIAAGADVAHAAAGAAGQGNILPDELELAGGRQRGDILPEDLRLVGAQPGDAEDARQRAARAAAARQNLEHGPAAALPGGDIPTAEVDEIHEQARREIDAQQHRHRVNAAKQNMTEGPADVLPADSGIDPAKQAQIDAARDMSHLTRAAGMGALGQGVAGAGDILAGVATADPLQVAIGGFQLVGAASTLTAEALDAATGGLRTITESYEHYIANDYLGAFENDLNAASSALDKIPVVGDALGAAFDLAAQPVRSFIDIVEAFVRRGHELAGLNAPLAQADAMAEVRSLMADLHEADTLGPDIARMIDAQSQISMELREFFLPIKEWLAETLAGWMESLVETVRDIRAFLEGIEAAVKDLPDFLADMSPFSGVTVGEALAHIKAKMDKAEEEARRRATKIEDSTLIDRFYGALRVPADAPVIPDAGRDWPGGFDIPII